MRFATQKDTTASKFFKQKGILTVEHLDMNYLADIFRLEIQYVKFKSKVLYRDSFTIMALTEGNSIIETRRTFFHELSHHFNHYGSQNKMDTSFRDLQESQARWLSLYYAMPLHIFEPLLIKYKDPKYLAELFELPIDMILERCETIKRERSRSEQYDVHRRKEFVHRVKSKSLQPGKVHNGTLSILNQLKNQVGKERMSNDVTRLL
ncbi:ImmA/IrrE family metallo-endopeptidase [Alkalicoccobacillus plakortidis]|uniref:ImmA/IrrE family metallo-endopeptidase n=1 Tax=Alkalicoccobacillus plakortidis TaxID=444060 RepID=A0ABT0XPB9_9BACI|nr:ImmA/IrrE family metallo-endopeptidase [Alkalicoccobacillus plakortidis]MCM2677738.1 ImmA/IrrE family metallo-endopeptidase [Alkalicoccobacillus plakortidis]